MRFHNRWAGGIASGCLFSQSVNDDESIPEPDGGSGCRPTGLHGKADHATGWRCRSTVRCGLGDWSPTSGVRGHDAGVYSREEV